MSLGSMGFTSACAVAAALLMACGAEPPADPRRSPPAAEVTAAPAVATAPAPPAQPAPSPQATPAAAPAPLEEPTAPFRQRKGDALWITRGGSRIGLPEDARAAFDGAPLSR